MVRAFATYPEEPWGTAPSIRRRMRKGVLLVLPLVSGAPPLARCPSDMVLAADGVCIDRYEWPNIAGQKPLLAASATPEREDLAAGIVMDAERLCQGVGKRLCSEHEWVSACLGPGGSRYPFGSRVPRFIPGRGAGLCNYDKLYREVDEYKIMVRDPVELQRLDQSEPAGSRDTCISASGAMDMMGSAEEWVRAQDGYALAGRFWAEPWSCYSMARGHAPNWHYYQSGFRCCLDLETS